MLRIVCVLKSGGVYSPLWVGRLRCNIAKHAPPHRFVCLSDVDVPCERISLQHDWPGWWAKLEVFRLRGPVLYLDLDTLPMGNMDDICGQVAKHQFIALRDFYRPTGLGSGMMAWNGNLEAIYAGFEAAMNLGCDPVMGWPGGDQQYLEQIFARKAKRWQDLLPGQVVSYKADNCETWPPDAARVMCFHGIPKFTDLPPEHWARKEWANG